MIVPLPGHELDVVGAVEADVKADEPASRTAKRSAQPSDAERRREQVKALHAALDRGLENLPLGPRQRARARSLSREAVRRDLFANLRDSASAPSPSQDLVTQSVAAAIAYAIVYVDHVPLTQAEVAAPFRVSVARLRGRFAELRAKLDLASR
jgi:hypothetical protein